MESTTEVPVVQSGMPATDHAEFDALCGELGEYEAMPTPQEDAARRQAAQEPDEQLDDQILAGLVTP